METKAAQPVAAVAPEAAQPAAEIPVAVKEMRKRELIDAVVKRSGVKKKDAKPVVEAVLAVLGETLADGRELNLHPFGKAKINRAQKTEDGRVIVFKLRQKDAAPEPAKDPLAEAAE